MKNQPNWSPIGVEYINATDAQKKLVREAQKMVGLKIDPYKEKLLVLGEKEEWGGRATYVPGPGYSHLILTCGSSPDLDKRLYFIYHELGHIEHRDFLPKDPDLIDSIDFKKDQKLIQKYIELGEKAYDSSTEVGRKVLSYVHTTPKPPLWIPPQNESAYKKHLVARYVEQTADLYACEQLWKQHLITPLLFLIEDFANNGRITAYEDDDTHASHMEIALYITGFLVDHGVNINKAFAEWEKQGICTDAEKLYVNKFLLALEEERSQIDNELIKLQEKRQKEWQQIKKGI